MATYNARHKTKIIRTIHTVNINYHGDTADSIIDALGKVPKGAKVSEMQWLDNDSLDFEITFVCENETQ